MITALSSTMAFLRPRRSAMLHRMDGRTGRRGQYCKKEHDHVAKAKKGEKREKTVSLCGLCLQQPRQHSLLTSSCRENENAPRTNDSTEKSPNRKHSDDETRTNVSKLAVRQRYVSARGEATLEVVHLEEVGDLSCETIRRGRQVSELSWPSFALCGLAYLCHICRDGL
jgi:hypothetical protein